MCADEKPRLTVLTRYDTLGASSRLRTFQYRRHLAAAGLAVAYLPLFEDSYLRALYAGRPTTAAGLKALLRRAAQLVLRRRPHAIWLEKEALPWMPWTFERLLLPRRIPVIADYDDAIFHRYDRHGSAAIRYALGAKIDRIMRAACLVTAGNAYLAQRAQASGAARVAVVPTVIDMARYPAAPSVRSEPIVGWIGSPSTWRAYVEPMLPMLVGIVRAAGARLAVVGAPEAAGAVPDVLRYDWQEETEVAHLAAMSVGIMPLADTPWARGKCGYKLIQYMACGVPVVASPVGAAFDIVEHGVNGFLAASPEEWRDRISLLLRDADLRRRMGEAGRRMVEERYSLQAVGPPLAAEIAAIATAARDVRAGAGR